MRSIRRRLALHFTSQFVLLLFFVATLVIITLLVIMQLLINADIKRTFPIGALDAILLDTTVGEERIHVPQRWIDQLTDRHYWLQVVDQNGKVRFAINTPADLKSSYNTGELLEIKQKESYGPYDVLSAYDRDRKEPLLFLLGFENENKKVLEALFQQHAEDGLLPVADLPQIDQALRESGNSLQIMDESGRIVQSAGEAYDETMYRPLDFYQVEAVQGETLSIFHDTESGLFWLLQREKSKMFIGQPLLKEAIMYLSFFGVVVLLFTLFISMYHGYRYGRPLLLFIEWFNRLGSGRYEEALSNKERKRLYRRNGKLRRRYKLYKEVIEGFHDMAARLNDARVERLRLEKTREEWMTGISHDLRTPLSSIQGYGHLMESGQFQWTEEELEEIGGTIREKSDYMLDLIQDFSLAFQLQNQAVPFEMEQVEAGEFVRRIVLKYVNDRTMQQVTFDYEESERPLALQANPKWFTRMLDNIIINAVKHNPAGTVITVATVRDGKDAVISIGDNGVGMNEETRNSLFDRYYRGTNTEEGADGAGLGMNIAKSIALAHRGSIEVSSAEECGTTITLRFPCDPI
ncbi:sensor histidine kinase [Paenibacillaceae bacterium]|nr:sensor histidine kinase [Paenibacillaceae bacterium]